jgi:hypothetical protein
MVKSIRGVEADVEDERREGEERRREERRERGERGGEDEAQISQPPWFIRGLGMPPLSRLDVPLTTKLQKHNE